MNDILSLSATKLGQKIKAGDISPVDAVDACLARIDATEPKLNAYVRVLADEARAAAKQAEKEIAAGQWKGPLHGVPVALKDLYDLADVPTTASSRVRENWTPNADSAAAERLKAAGAIVLGKTHTHEFAYGIVTPTTRNPWDTERTPGGSSGGSGATVASAGAFMAMGSDTGGSIRIPAGLCGTVGLKPTFGRVSRAGITSLSWGLDHAGPLTRTVEDAATCLQVLAGYDPRDPGSVDEPVPDYSAGLRDGIKGLRVGVPTNYFFDQLDAEVEAAVRKAYEQLESLGAELVDVALPMPEQIVAVEFAILLPEASDYHRQMLRDSAHLYNDDVRVMLEAGEFVPATTYIRAQRVRNLLQQEFRKLYDKVDVIVAPSVAATAVTAGTESITWPDGSEEPLISAYTRFSLPGNVTGLPAMSVPCGFTENGLPIGFQAIGRPFDESTVLRLGAAYEAATDWHQRRPDI
ncbi:amidase [Salinisphaera orenii]|uniref:Amidase n=1 Tax=Salinisphaera orenii YIM 95161 TaxID=1051139 RepID=A0A423PRG9_9GAMM|nr:amidase [Salinisphaera halophila]ROO28177.1 amidase [Salinisphaera halophila YIM 95161]